MVKIKDIKDDNQTKYLNLFNLTELGNKLKCS